jgi:hypothetical protein
MMAGAGLMSQMKIKNKLTAALTGTAVLGGAAFQGFCLRATLAFGSLPPSAC